MIYYLQPNVLIPFTTITPSFSSLAQSQFYFKLSECLFAQESIEYLEHIIFGSGVAPHQSKVDAMVN